MNVRKDKGFNAAKNPVLSALARDSIIDALHLDKYSAMVEEVSLQKESMNLLDLLLPGREDEEDYYDGNEVAFYFGLDNGQSREEAAASLLSHVIIGVIGAIGRRVDTDIFSCQTLTPLDLLLVTGSVGIHQPVVRALGTMWEWQNRKFMNSCSQLLMFCRDNTPSAAHWLQLLQQGNLSFGGGDMALYELPFKVFAEEADSWPSGHTPGSPSSAAGDEDNRLEFKLKRLRGIPNRLYNEIIKRPYGLSSKGPDLKVYLEPSDKIELLFSDLISCSGLYTVFVKSESWLKIKNPEDRAVGQMRLPNVFTHKKLPLADSSLQFLINRDSVLILLVSGNFRDNVAVSDAWIPVEEAPLDKPRPSSTAKPVATSSSATSSSSSKKDKPRAKVESSDEESSADDEKPLERKQKKPDEKKKIDTRNEQFRKEISKHFAKRDIEDEEEDEDGGASRAKPNSSKNKYQFKLSKREREDDCESLGSNSNADILEDLELSDNESEEDVMFNAPEDGDEDQSKAIEYFARQRAFLDPEEIKKRKLRELKKAGVDPDKAYRVVTDRKHRDEKDKKQTTFAFASKSVLQEIDEIEDSDDDDEDDESNTERKSKKRKEREGYESDQGKEKSEKKKPKQSEPISSEEEEEEHQSQSDDLVFFINLSDGYHCKPSNLFRALCSLFDSLNFMPNDKFVISQQAKEDWEFMDTKDVERFIAEHISTNTAEMLSILQFASALFIREGGKETPTDQWLDLLTCNPPLYTLPPRDKDHFDMVIDYLHKQVEGINPEDRERNIKGRKNPWLLDKTPSEFLQRIASQPHLVKLLKLLFKH